MSLRRPRLIPRLDIKGPNVVKGVQMEGLRVIGNPADLARRYAEDADELLFIDTVASLYGRNQLTALLEETTNDVFIPVTVAGGIKSRADIKRLLDAGADKVAINTAAIGNPAILREASDHYGAQCIVLSIEAKRTGRSWEALTDCGRQRTGKDALLWAEEAVALGVGEILVTSVDQDGTKRGFDYDLVRAIAPRVPVPVIAAGGCGRLADVVRVVEESKADAVAIGTALHYNLLTIGECRGPFEKQLQAAGRSEAGRAAA